MLKSSTLRGVRSLTCWVCRPGVLWYAVGSRMFSLNQEKAFDRVGHDYLCRQTLEGYGFRFSSGPITKIQTLYGDTESVLKINGGLSAPFKVKRGVRQGCHLSGMLYSLAVEPLL